MLRLIRRYLQAGMMEGGVVSPRAEGTPQGGPLSPLLSNILPDELDKELENRGHRFVRYSAKRLKEKLKPILRRGRGRSLRRVIEELKPILRGWAAYYKLSETRGVFEELDGWIRRKLRCILWRQWKKPKTRRPEPASTNHLPCGQVLDLVSLLDENKRFADLR
ncbi:MAG: group II intron maturase-specific domain-containing protein [Bradymonadaceae bacterium]